MADHVTQLPLRDGLPVWSAIALESFGGPVAQIAVIHRMIVQERGWVSEERFQRALAFCVLLPGPEAQQLATYLGWILHGARGAIVAGSLFVLPGFLVLLGLSMLYVYAGSTAAATGVLWGIKPAVVAILAHALVRMARRTLTDRTRAAVAVAAFVTLFFMRIPFPIVLAVAAAVGALRFSHAILPDKALGTRSRRLHPFISGVLWLVLWLAPLVAFGIALGWTHVIVQEGRFFATSALMTFGGAYAVLAYVAQEAVQRFHWVEPSEMVAGLGLAESTPGPLIQVVQFVAFLGAFRAPGVLDPLTSGILASLLVTWVTFVPSFYFILALGPIMERFAQNRFWLGALLGVAAAVFGAILNLATWFALYTLFGDVREVVRTPFYLTLPQFASLDVAAVLVAMAALAALVFLRVKHLWILGAAAVTGLVLQLWS